MAGLSVVDALRMRVSTIIGKTQPFGKPPERSAVD
jgi:hypothetical protein